MRIPLLALATLGLLVRPGTVSAQENDRINFTAEVAPGDPFAPGHEKRAVAKPLKVQRGQTILVTILGTPKEGFHTYPFTHRTSTQEIEQLSRIKRIEAGKGIVQLWPLRESESELHEEKTLGAFFREHHAPFTVTQELAVLADAAPGPQQVKFHLQGQVCDDKGCLPFDIDVTVSFDVTGEPPLPISADLTSRLSEKMPAPSIILRPGETEPGPKTNGAAPMATPNNVDKRAVGLIGASHEQYKTGMEALAKRIVNRTGVTAAGSESDLLAFIMAGIFWGAISLITPCVFPMIPITVSFFLKQSEKEHHKPITMALVYSATIIIVLTLAAAFLLEVFRWLSIDPLMNYAMGALFVFFALSLFGWYDIELPSGLARFTSAHEGQGGIVGTVFMALTFTIISFACVAPFLGGFGGTAGSTARPFWHTLLGGVAFSATFAAPFFLLALFPTLLKKMPKSGSWLNSVKVVMGFLELAAAFKFFRTAELNQSAAPSFFTFDLVLSVWVALCFLCGLYLLNVYRLPHDTPAENVSVPRLLFSGAFLALGFYLLPALFKTSEDGAPQRPVGTIYAWVDSFLLPEARPVKDEMKSGNLEYAVAQAQEHRRRTGQVKRVFLDFTGFT